MQDLCEIPLGNSTPAMTLDVWTNRRTVGRMYIQAVCIHMYIQIHTFTNTYVHAHIYMYYIAVFGVWDHDSGNC